MSINGTNSNLTNSNLGKRKRASSEGDLLPVLADQRKRIESSSQKHPPAQLKAAPAQQKTLPLKKRPVTVLPPAQLKAAPAQLKAAPAQLKAAPAQIKASIYDGLKNIFAEITNPKPKTQTVATMPLVTTSPAATMNRAKFLELFPKTKANTTTVTTSPAATMNRAKFLELFPKTKANTTTVTTSPAATLPVATPNIKTGEATQDLFDGIKENDVIWMRGGKGNTHPGSKAFRDLVESYKEAINAAGKSTNAKQEINKEIYGNFMRENTSEDGTAPKFYRLNLTKKTREEITDERIILSRISTIHKDKKNKVEKNS